MIFVEKLMPTFAFQARDRGGKAITGTREAADQRSALEALREAGLFVTDLTPTRASQAPPQTQVSSPTAVTPQSPALQSASQEAAVHQSTLMANVAATTAPAMLPEAVPAGPHHPPQAPPRTANPNQSAAFDAAMTTARTDWWARANSKQLSLYFRQMHSMLHAGTSLAQALAVLGQHEANPALRRASHIMHLRTSRGVPWSETMRAYPGLFSELMLGMVEAGEAGGFLDRVCLRLAEYAERDYEIQQTIKRETWYPKLLVFCSFLIPSVVPLFLQGFGAWFKFVLPPFLFISALWIGGKVVGYFLPLSSHARGWRKAIDSIKLYTPVVGKTVRGFAVSKFCHALSATYSAGMAPHKSVRIAAQACGNVAIAESALAIIPRLERGDSMTESLAGTGHFQPVVLQMLRTGEESGRIDEQLDKVAEFLEADAETSVKQAVKVLGILVFLAIALYIGSQVISFWTGYLGDLTSAGEM
jgi:type IV pilus assembly protein PilC